MQKRGLLRHPDGAGHPLRDHHSRAREIGREAEIGSIEPGKLADFVVCAPDLTPKAVYLGGEIVE